MNFPVYFRQVIGISMIPTIRPGKIVFAARSQAIKPGNVVIVRLEGIEIVKRVKNIKNNKIYILGDNQEHSTDSRSYGWLNKDQIVGKVIWPKFS